MARKKPATAPPRGGRLDAQAWIEAALDALALGGVDGGAGGAARQGARGHQGQLLLAFP